MYRGTPISAADVCASISQQYVIVHQRGHATSSRPFLPLSDPGQGGSRPLLGQARLLGRKERPSLETALGMELTELLITVAQKCPFRCNKSTCLYL